MTGDREPPARSLPLPVLKPRPRPADPFSAGMAAVVAGGADDASPLERQAQPERPRPQARKKPRPAVQGDGETARVHCRIPLSLMIEFQVYCARNRTSMQDVLERLIEEFMAGQAG